MPRRYRSPSISTTGQRSGPSTPQRRCCSLSGGARTPCSSGSMRRPPCGAPALPAPCARCSRARWGPLSTGLDALHPLRRCRTPGDVRRLFPHARLVVKNAEIGATEFSGEEHTFVPGPVVDVVELVGAGDAFAAGCLTALLRG